MLGSNDTRNFLGVPKNFDKISDDIKPSEDRQKYSDIVNAKLACTIERLGDINKISFLLTEKILPSSGEKTQELSTGVNMAFDKQKSSFFVDTLTSLNKISTEIDILATTLTKLLSEF